jgi:hypothetical protein
MSLSSDWMFQGLSHNVTDEYKVEPFKWAGATSMVKYVGPDAAREEALARGKTAFAGRDWTSEENFTAEEEGPYKSLLKTYYSAAALRLQVHARTSRTHTVTHTRARPHGTRTFSTVVRTTVDMSFLCDRRSAMMSTSSVWPRRRCSMRKLTSSTGAQLLAQPVACCTCTHVRDM